MGLRVTPEELSSVQSIEQNCAKHLSVLNDIASWDKEYVAAQRGHPEGSALCSAVQILAAETSLTYGAVKRVLWVMCREWELEHEVLVAERVEDKEFPASAALLQYIVGLEYQMGGNELWSRTTLRYNASQPPGNGSPEASCLPYRATDGCYKPTICSGALGTA